MDWMDDGFYNKIRGNFNPQALIYSAMHALDITAIPTITFHRRGGWNNICLIQFPDGRKVAARIPKQSGRLPHSVDSTVAMMAMAHYHHHIPVPDIYAWHGNNKNPVGAPYMLLEWVEGIEPWQKWYELPAERRTVLLDDLAKYHAVFAQPMPWQTLGNIFFADGQSMNDVNLDLADASTYRMGPFVHGPSCTEYRHTSIHPTTTCTSIVDFWIQLWKDEVDLVIAAYGNDRSTIIITADHPHYLIEK
jgi:Phosphotransferase enzyme family